MNKPVFIGLSTCSTCRKLAKLVPNIPYRDLRQSPLSKEEIKTLVDKVSIDRLYNTNGQSYRNGKIKEKRLTLSVDEQIALLASDPMLIKRPILVLEDQVIVGNQPELYPKG